jgi:hypothetical protein
MPYIGTYALSSPLTVFLQTTSPNTASAVDADALPSYKVYINLVSAPLTSGTFSLIDGVNVDGFYAAQFVLSTTHGFSASGTYCIRKAASVSLVSAAQIDVFRIFLST